MRVSIQLLMFVTFWEFPHIHDPLDLNLFVLVESIQIGLDPDALIAATERISKDKTVKRSKSVILAKNLPPSFNEDRLSSLFSPFGTLGKVRIVICSREVSHPVSIFFFIFYRYLDFFFVFCRYRQFQIDSMLCLFFFLREIFYISPPIVFSYSIEDKVE